MRPLYGWCVGWVEPAPGVLMSVGSGFQRARPACISRGLPRVYFERKPSMTDIPSLILSAYNWSGERVGWVEGVTRNPT
jgi:hypothetical protein